MDSSVIVAVLKLLGIPEIHTFALGFRIDEKRARLCEDLEWAERGARFFGTEHHSIEIARGHDPTALLPKVWKQFDEPMLTPNAYSKHLLFEAAARAGVQACFSGLAAESQFACTTEKYLGKIRKRVIANATNDECVLEGHRHMFSSETQRELLALDCPDPHEEGLGIIAGFTR